MALSEVERLRHEIDGLVKSDAKWKRKAERRGVLVLELQDKAMRQRHEIKRLEELLAGLYKLDEPTSEIIRRRIARAVPRLARREAGESA